MSYLDLRADVLALQMRSYIYAMLPEGSTGTGDG